MPPGPSVPDLPTTHFGRYEVVRRLGRGGMGEVFEARHLDLGKRVAIKVMHPAIAADVGAIERALREGRAAAAVRHPHVVMVLDVGVEDDVPYLVMDLLEGEDLAAHLAQRGPLPVEEIAGLLLPVASGVHAAHRAGIVHRDLKPSNVLLARRRRGIEPVVVDFGVSKIVRPAPSAVTSASGAPGTTLYMSPEQVRGSREVSAKTDQYALGVILYECATGGAPFWGDDPYELLHAIVTAPVVPPSEINPAIPPALDAVILRALARDPDARFPSVAALGAALLRFASPEARRAWSTDLTEAAEEAARAGRASSWIHRASRRRVALAVGGALAITAGVALAEHHAWLTRGAERSQATAIPAIPSAPAHEAIAAPARRRNEAAAPSAPIAEPLSPPAPTPVIPRTAARPSAARPVAPSAPPAGSVERGTANIPILE